MIRITVRKNSFFIQLSNFLQQHHCFGPHRGAVPDRVDALARFRLDADSVVRYLHRRRQAFAHSVDVGPKLRRFEADSRIDVADLVTAAFGLAYGESQEDKTLRVAP